MASLARMVALRPGEGRLVALVAGTFAAVEMGRGLGEVGVDTLVLDRLGGGALPYLYVGLGIVGLVITLAYGAGLARTRSRWFFPALLLITAAVLALQWLAALSGAEAILPALWVTVYAVGLLLLTVTWTVAASVFDARQAKRLFPLLTSAAIVGSLAGFLSAIVVQRLVGAPQLILAEAFLFCAAAALLAALGPRLRPRRRPGEIPPSLRRALTTGASYVAASPLMRLVALAYVLLAILMFSITFPFMTAMREAFPSEGDLLTALALFSAAVTAISFAIGTLLANRVYTRLGVATAALALPIVYLAGFGLWLVRFTLATAIVVRLGQQVTQRGLSNAAWGAFFNVIPSGRRGPVMAFMDGVPGQVGTMLSGVLLLAVSSQALEPVFLMGLVTASVCLVVVLGIRRAYASSLVATLREGIGEQVLEGGPGLAGLAGDPAVMSALRQAAGSDRPSDRLLAAELLGRMHGPEVGDLLAPLATDPEPTVRAAAIDASARANPEGTAALAHAALDDPDEAVRVAAIDALSRLQDTATLVSVASSATPHTSPHVRGSLAVALASAGEATRAERILDELLRSDTALERREALAAIARIERPLLVEAVAGQLDDPDSGVRAAALRAWAAHSSDGTSRFLGGLDDAALEVRLAAADALRARPDGARAALTVLAEGSERAQEAALMVLGGVAVPPRDELIAWSDRQVARATELRRHGAALSQADRTSSAAFLGSVLRRRESAIEARLLTALAILGAPEAGGLIRRCLHAVDPEVRAQAIEALDALGDARLARGVVRLLDSDAGARGESLDGITAATALRADRDPWVRALALRTLAEYLRDEQRAIAAMVRSDPDDLVRSAVEVTAIEDEEDGVVGSLRLVGDIERMLVLRHVPLFEALSPEDLQRVASSAAERRWSGGEALVREGDVGDELVVIVEGVVRVVHEVAGGEHLIRRYGPGDHIGELAVLRAAPRAATVIAEDGGVRGLIISGEAISALLRERPDAAMAMLATLAERLSQQS